jgi:hypothetical protein
MALVIVEHWNEEVAFLALWDLAFAIKEPPRPGQELREQEACKSGHKASGHDRTRTNTECQPRDAAWIAYSLNLISLVLRA